MPNLKYLNINGVNYSLGRDTRIHYGSTSETITDLQEGDLLIDLVGTPPAGKNLLSCLASTTTIGGITYTVNNDGTVYASGTSQGTNQATLDYGHVILPAGTYTLTGCPEGGADSTYRIRLGINSYVGTFLDKDTGSGKTFTLTETTDVYARIYIQPAAGAVNLVFSPMICFSSESNSTYEQYNGNTYAVSVVGDQLINKSTNESGAIDANGNDVANASFNRTQLISVNSGTLCFRITVVGFYNVRIHGYNNGTWVEQLALLQTNDGFNEISVSVPSTVNQVRVSYPVAGLNTSYLYKNYRGTIYGGTLDVVSGQLTVDRKYFTADEKTWSWGGGTYVYTNIADTDKTQRTVVLSSHFQSRTESGTADGYVSWGGSPNNGNMIVRSSAVAPDLASWNTYISNNTVQFVYELATPLTYQLTATQVALLRGDSKIWSDSGDTSVIYTNINDTTSTASGSIANIISAKKASAQSVVTEINCKQNLNGYDHPWIGGAGKNIYPEYQTQTANGVTITKDHGKITINGKATADTWFDIDANITFEQGATFYLNSFNPVASSSSRLSIFVITTAGNSQVNLHNVDASYTTTVSSSGTLSKFRLRVPVDVQYTNYVLYPYFQINGTAPTTWEPYENICPITGYNNINITKINPLYDTSETGTRMYKYNEDATWTEISVSGNGGLLNLENGSATGSVRGINTSFEDGTYVMGQNAVAIGGSTQAAGANSFTSGLGTVAQRGSQVVFGEYNTLDTTGSTSTRGDYIFMLGNGTSNARSNATTIDWEGSIDTHGAITAGSIDNGYGLNDQALLASDTIALWEDIING